MHASRMRGESDGILMIILKEQKFVYIFISGMNLRKISNVVGINAKDFWVLRKHYDSELRTEKGRKF